MSTKNEIHRCCKVVNKYGLHTRTAAAIVELLEQFDCEMVISSEKGESDAKDMIRLMLLEASKGTKLCVSATGVDAQIAVDTMSEFIDAGFNE